VTVLVMNLEQRLRAFLFFCCRWVLCCWQAPLGGADKFSFTGRPHARDRSSNRVNLPELSEITFSVSPI
ncbi:MAG: hypothetical protein AAF622_05500, partial [Cyanobacteria bacterium P01_C01_bin.147]